MRYLAAVFFLLFSLPAFAQTGAILSSGYFTVSGNQLLDGSGNPQRLACTQFLGSPNDGTMAAIRAQGQFNCVVIDWRDQMLSATGGLPATGCNTTAQIVTCVANASANNLKVILSHRGNEIPTSSTSPCWSRQANGLPFDSGGDSGNDDGCNDGHNVTYVQFLQNTVTLLQQFNGNSTVVGYQIHHEPLVKGVYTGQANATGTNAAICWNCGQGDTDWMCIAQEVGNDVAVVNANVVEFVPGPINTTTTLLNGQPLSTGSGMMDLSAVSASPVGGGSGPAATKVAYSVDLYPSNVTSVTPDSGSTAITAWNTFFGYIEKNAQAPVMFMETGCSCDNTNGQLADDQAFMNTFVAYANGLAANGPAFSGRNQPMSTSWYAWGNLTSNPNGTLNANGSNKSGQFAYWEQLLFAPPPAVATTWNPNDQTNLVLSNSNLTATATTTQTSSVRSTTSKTSGKYCWEIIASSISNDWDTGVASGNYSLSLASWLGGDTNGIGYAPNFDGGSPQGFGIFFPSLPGGVTSAATTGQVDISGASVTICADFGALLFWVTSPGMRSLFDPFSSAFSIAFGAGGIAWNNSATANPATGTGGISFSGVLPPYFIAFQEFQPGAATLNTAGPFTVATPAGFSAWDASIPTSQSRPFFIILGANDNHHHSNDNVQLASREISR